MYRVTLSFVKLSPIEKLYDIIVENYIYDVIVEGKKRWCLESERKNK